MCLQKFILTFGNEVVHLKNECFIFQRADERFRVFRERF